MKHFWIGLLLLVGCYRVPNKIEPQICYSVEQRYLERLPTCFSPLTNDEKSHEWGKEYLIGTAFAKELDLYRAITAFKRAQILLPDDKIERKREVSYNIILSYYLGKRYTDVIDSFESSNLTRVGSEFCAFHDLLVILYESYDAIGADIKADQVLKLMQKTYPETADKLEEENILSHGNITQLKQLACQTPDKTYLQAISDCFELNKKSVGKAQLFNTLLPGAGYLYVGQKQSAVTAFLLNGAFITAAYFFFKDGNIAAGVITTSFEAGWYFGGIYGAGEAAKLYNERLYENIASHTMERERLFPVFSLRYAF
ncbi:MAG: tetratricopeptide repeat protein [Chlamydiia bacterium]|nr:tetratricopeptide repeat protein [Chlamydiia bacterium]